MDEKADMTQFYFPDLKPFVFPFSVLKEIPQDFKLKINVDYTYCTVKDGFCAPRKKSFEIPITLKNQDKTGK